MDFYSPHFISLNSNKVSIIQLRGEQEESSNYIKEVFQSLNGGVYMGYNTHGYEWGYIIFKSYNENHGSIIRASSHNKGVQYMSYASNSGWSNWSNL